MQLLETSIASKYHACGNSADQRTGARYLRPQLMQQVITQSSVLPSEHSCLMLGLEASLSESVRVVFSLSTGAALA
jgi:hypothetical protein